MRKLALNDEILITIVATGFDRGVSNVAIPKKAEIPSFFGGKTTTSTPVTTPAPTNTHTPTPSASTQDMGNGDLDIPTFLRRKNK